MSEYPRGQTPFMQYLDDFGYFVTVVTPEWQAEQQLLAAQKHITKEFLKVVSGKPSLDHSKCQFSTGADGELTAGQGELSYWGYFEIPCPECVARLTKEMEVKHPHLISIKPDSCKKPSL